MTARELFACIGEVDEDLILEAAAPQPPRRKPALWLRFAPAAAGLFLVAGAALYLNGALPLPGSGYASAASDEQTNAPETLLQSAPYAAEAEAEAEVETETGAPQAALTSGGDAGTRSTQSGAGETESALAYDGEYAPVYAPLLDIALLDGASGYAELCCDGDFSATLAPGEVVVVTDATRLGWAVTPAETLTAQLIFENDEDNTQAAALQLGFVCDGAVQTSAPATDAPLTLTPAGSANYSLYLFNQSDKTLPVSGSITVTAN